MTFGYLEYHLHEIDEFLASGIESKNSEVAELLRVERDEILHCLRHNESLPKEIK